MPTIKQKHHNFPFIAFILLLTAFDSQAEQRIISADGREVLLEDNGTWRYLSDDRIVDTGDGKQVRLKADGSWQHVGNTPLKTDSQVSTTDTIFLLDKVVVETQEKKVQKNTRVKTQTVFYIDVQLSPQATDNININSEIIDYIEVIDNKEKRYPVLSVSPHGVVKAGDSQLVTVRVKKSPSVWDDARSMQVVFKKGLFGIPQTITLSRKISDFEQQKVEAFKH